MMDRSTHSSRRAMAFMAWAVIGACLAASTTIVLTMVR